MGNYSSKKSLEMAVSHSEVLTLTQRYIASMVLSGVGDALGYKNGEWEFCHSGRTIHKELKHLGGLSKIKIKGWMVSDDTVMHIATAEALIKASGTDDFEKLYLAIAQKYKECMHDMGGRSPGPTTMNSVHKLKPKLSKGYQIPFNKAGGGCGAAMRAMCIGLRYPREEELSSLIRVSVESGRMTHHHPTGYLGAYAAALFTAYAIQGKPVKFWGHGLMSSLDKVKDYIKSEKRDVQDNLNAWDYFCDHWCKYLETRNLTNGETEPVFPEGYGIEQRDAFYKSVSYSGWGGASGHDAPLIAYDALLGARDDWSELCSRGMFHSGDSDSTAVMAGAWFGALYGFKGVPDNLYKHLEYCDRLVTSGIELMKLSHPGEPVDSYFTGCEQKRRSEQDMEEETGEISREDERSKGTDSGAKMAENSGRVTDSDAEKPSKGQSVADSDEKKSEKREENPRVSDGQEGMEVAADESETGKISREDEGPKGTDSSAKMAENSGKVTDSRADKQSKGQSVADSDKKKSEKREENPHVSDCQEGMEVDESEIGKTSREDEGPEGANSGANKVENSGNQYSGESKVEDSKEVKNSYASHKTEEGLDGPETKETPTEDKGSQETGSGSNKVENGDKVTGSDTNNLGHKMADSNAKI